ncbi:MAG: ATP-binding cassette domain-containing protein [Proteobacteria bacterium]|nr:ATP-binding cassette domain-containing protein [Pseudomonadota bacterium]
MLEVGDVSFSYHLYRKVFSCVSFQLDKGEIIHLRGGNGSGKTTLLRGLMGLVDLRFATISLAGYTDLREFRRRCWYMPSEHHGLFTHLTAWDNLVCFRQLQNRDVADKDLCDHLRDFGFGSSYLCHHLLVKSFSTGMKRRLALCKLACFQRPLWLLDEPTYGLDKQGIHQLCLLLKAHQESEGMTVVASHDESIFASLNVRCLSLEDYKS